MTPLFTLSAYHQMFDKMRETENMCMYLKGKSLYKIGRIGESIHEFARILAQP